jgi:hypothetical protein
VDFVSKFEKALRKRHHSLMTELGKIEHLIDAFEKGAKRGAKKGRVGCQQQRGGKSRWHRRRDGQRLAKQKQRRRNISPMRMPT